MITSWWPLSLAVGVEPVQWNQDLVPKPESTIAKVSLVSKLLHTLWWASLLYGTQAQQTDPFPERFELSGLDGTNGFIIYGEAENDLSGYSVSSASDINGDGLADVVIGAYKAAPSGLSEAGKTYVVFGNRNPISCGTLDLSNLNGTNGFIIHGEAGGDRSGISVSSAGDVNGDGISDIVIGAYYADPLGRSKAGKSYVVFGTSKLIRGGVFELSSLNGSNGFIINCEAGDDESGKVVSSAGDVNGDGIDDLVIGAPQAAPSGRLYAGKSYVVFGSRNAVNNDTIDLSKLNGSNGFVLNGEAANDRSGWSVSSAGDVNGDGLSDIVIGARYASLPGRQETGKSYVVFGSRNSILGGQFELSNINGSNGFILLGEAAYDRSGGSVSSAGDVNGDGIEDLVVGADRVFPSGLNDAGKSYVLFGSRNFSSLLNNGTLELSSLKGNTGFILKGESSGNKSHFSVSSAGDVNRDGLSDFLLGAPLANPSGKIDGGKSYMVYGSRKIVSGGTIYLSRLNGQNGFIINGEAADDRSGYSASSAGDVNGDGFDDLVIGAYLATPSDRSKAGKSYVVFGRNHTSSTQTLPPSICTTKFPSPTTTSTLLPLPSFGTLKTTSQAVPTINPKAPQSSSGKFGITLTKVHSSSQRFLELSTISHVSSIPTVLLQASSTDSTPLIAGIAAAVAALACSLFGGVLFYFKRRPKKNKLEQGIFLSTQQPDPKVPAGYVAISSLQSKMQSARIANNYDILPTVNPQSDYMEWPQNPNPSSPDQYTSIDKVEKAHDEYEAAKIKAI